MAMASSIGRIGRVPSLLTLRRRFMHSVARPTLRWTDVYSESDSQRLRASSDGTVVRRSEEGTYAALAHPLYNSRHHVSIEAMGSRMLIGVAEADPDAPLDVSAIGASPWHRRAWGLALWNGQLFECSSMTALDERAARALPSLEVDSHHAPVAALESSTVVRITIDALSGSLRFVARNGEWTSSITTPPGRTYRPWVLFAGPGAPTDAVRLVASADLIQMPQRSAPTHARPAQLVHPTFEESV